MFGRGDSAPRYKPDWQCLSCLHVNFARRQVCEKCQAPRPNNAPIAYASTHAAVQEGAVAPTSFQRPMQQPMRVLGGGLSLGMGMQIAHVPAVLMPGDWCCPRTTCGALNQAAQRHCLVCGAPKDYQGPESALSFGGGGGARPAFPMQAAPDREYPPDWRCLSCDNVNFARRTDCKRCGAARTAESPETRLSIEYKPDWRCTSCDNVNFARRSECKQCGKPRTHDAPDAYAPNHAALKRGSGGIPSGGGGSSSMQGTKPGDWQCGCGYLNFARRAECGKCGEARPTGNTIRYSPY